MSESKVIEAEVVKGESKEVVEQDITPIQIISGEVHIIIDKNGAMQVNAPQNVLLALAIVKAGEVYLASQMIDAMKRSNAARPPVILRPGADALSKLRPS